MSQSLQDTYAPHGVCFGCGPANREGLQIKSFSEGNKTVCEWAPFEHHQAFPGVLNGGIIGTIMDCHSNWTAAHHMMQKNGWEKPECTVTAYFNVQLLRPTPANEKVRLEATIVESKDDRAKVLTELICKDKVCAKCEGLFVVVKPGHPAYHNWG
jgi:acyl-coenzyme A thioesterase PaaI-like protein